MSTCAKAECLRAKAESLRGKYPSAREDGMGHAFRTIGIAASAFRGAPIGWLAARATLQAVDALLARFRLPPEHAHRDGATCT